MGPWTSLNHEDSDRMRVGSIGMGKRSQSRVSAWSRWSRTWRQGLFGPSVIGSWRWRLEHFLLFGMSGFGQVDDPQAVAFASQRLWGSVGGVVLLIAVGMGAFGAHVVSNDVLPSVHGEADAKSVATMEVPAAYKAYLDYKTAVLYQMVHGFGIILAGLLGRRGKAHMLLQGAAYCFLVGTILFCGVLYWITTTGESGLHLLVPIGGGFFLLGWGFFIAAAAMPRTTLGR